MKSMWASLLAVAVVWLAGPLQAQTAPPPNDYSDRGNWACFPGATPNACQTELDTTFISADGGTRVETFKADPDPKIDCFYVYPTVSTDPGLLATMKLEREERAVIAQQFARFGSVCRLYAPLYRQFTITALRAAMTGHPLEGSNPRPLTPYLDVRDAWRWYLAHENHGRGVVLIGHSQGSAILTPLIAHDIEGQPSQKLLVSAILMGTGLGVPKGADVGGDFKSVPLCHSARQLGCVIAYASFRDDSPPPPNARFGRPRTPGPGLVAACVNPANLSGGVGALKSYFSTGRDIVADAAPPKTWLTGGSLETPYVATPGLATAQCVSANGFDYLAIHVNKNEPGPRAHDIQGDIVVGGVVLKDWGLHLIDANLAMGNLIDIVREEGRAWAAAH